MKDEQNSPPQGIDRTEMFGAREGNEGIIRCDACPVLCRIRPGRSGACDRYANADGRLIRTDPLVLVQRVEEEIGASSQFNAGGMRGGGFSSSSEEKEKLIFVKFVKFFRGLRVLSV